MLQGYFLLRHVTWMLREAWVLTHPRKGIDCLHNVDDPKLFLTVITAVSAFS